MSEYFFVSPVNFVTEKSWKCELLGFSSWTIANFYICFLNNRSFKVKMLLI